MHIFLLRRSSIKMKMSLESGVPHVMNGKFHEHYRLSYAIIIRRWIVRWISCFRFWTNTNKYVYFYFISIFKRKQNKLQKTQCNSQWLCVTLMYCKGTSYTCLYIYIYIYVYIWHIIPEETSKCNETHFNCISCD